MFTDLPNLIFTAHVYGRKQAYFLIWPNDGGRGIKMWQPSSVVYTITLNCFTPTVTLCIYYLSPLVLK